MYQSEEKEVPDTPMVEPKNISFNDFSQRESYVTSSDYNYKNMSRFQEDFL